MSDVEIRFIGFHVVPLALNENIMGKFNDFLETGVGQLATGGLGSLVNGLFNIGSSKRQFRYQSKLQQQQYQLNEQAAENAYARQKDFYNIQNEYNDPTNVKARYEKAGVNPTSAFGTAGSYTPAQQAATAPQGAGAGLGSVSALVPRDPIEQAFRMAQIENINADTEKKRGETLDPEQTKYGQELSNKAKELGLINQEQQNKITDLNRQFLEDTLPIREKQEQQKLDNMAQQYQQMAADIALKASQERLNDENARVAVEQVGKLLAETALLKTQNDWYGRISSKQIEQMNAQIKLWANQMSLNDSIKFLNSAKEWNIMADTTSKDLDNWSKELMNNLKGLEYGSGAGTDPSATGELWYAVQKLFDLIHLFK